MVLYIWPFCGAVPMNDNLAEILFRIEKLATNPHEVIGSLLFEGHARFDARMNEDVISRLVHKLQA